jgi:hypothetical protein
LVLLLLVLLLLVLLLLVLLLLFIAVFISMHHCERMRALVWVTQAHV